MQRLRNPNWLLTLLFIGMLGAVPLIQLLMEVRSDEGVIALEVFSQAPTAANLRAYEKKLEDTSWLGRLSRPWVQLAQFAWLKYGGEKVVVGSNGWYFFKPSLNYMLARPDLAGAAKSTNDPVAAIVDFRDQLATRGIHLIVMPVPNKDSIYPDRLTSRAKDRDTIMAPRTHIVMPVPNKDSIYPDRLTSRAKDRDTIMSPRTRDIMERLRATNVEVIDLFKQFSQARAQNDSNPETPLYLAQDTHWSPAGVDLAAKTVARRLTELGWLRPGQVDYGERPAPVQRTGDILRMLQTPGIERIIPPENVPASQIVRRDTSQLYKDEPNVDIVILGDSFMRIYQEDQPTAAGFIAHLAKELKQPILSLVNDGGGSTLVREELCARIAFLRNKKVLLWEFVERDISIGIKGWQRTPLPPDTSNTNIASQKH
jgi:hypothetical protein